MKCVVVGIGGCSNGGKTTLSDAIEAEFSNVVTMNMDNFYRDDNDSKLERLDIYDNQFANWDSLSSFNGPKFLKEFEIIYKKLCESVENHILVVEGIFVFHFSEIQNLFFKKYFFNLLYEEALHRRRARKYLRDEPWDYFEKTVWPAYEAIQEMVKHHKDIIHLDGSDDKQDIKKFVLNDIKESMSKEQSDKTSLQ